MQLVVCPNKECTKNNRRYYDQTIFCIDCGSKTLPIKTCCALEDITDHGYCSKCGTKKETVILYPCSRCDEMFPARELNEIEFAGKDISVCKSCELNLPAEKEYHGDIAADMHEGDR